METIYIELGNIDSIDNLSLCLGYFDAIHLGHIELINKAKGSNNRVGVMTLEPNPKVVFGGKKKNLNTFEDREEILSSLGVDYFIVLKTDLYVLSLSPKDFIEKVICKLGAKEVICGFDYTFGKNKAGNANVLKSLSHGLFDVHIVNEVKNDLNQKISTTLISSLIEEGRVKEANKYLYRPYQIKGIVSKGNRIGNSIGFPTANIELNTSFFLPKKGVYKGRCIIDGKEYISMINVGTHPTIKENDTIILEAHIIDFEKEIYDMNISVIFDYFLREEKKFSSIEELVNQLRLDRDYIIKKIA